MHLNLINVLRSLREAFFFDYTNYVRFHFKRFLLILMMLALPVQTFASAAMLGCAFSHQGPSAAPGMAMADEATPACHELEPPDAPSAKHNCKHCAACYMASALAIPSAVIVPLAPVPHSVIVPVASPSFVGFIPDSPERPPRTPFA